MVATTLFWLKWLWAGLAGYVVAWPVWIILGVVAGAAAYLLLPAVVPYQLRQAAAYTLTCIGIAFGMYSMGNADGIHLMEVTIERAKQEERDRLTEGFKKQAALEATRTIDAQAATGRLQQELDDVVREAYPQGEAGKGGAEATQGGANVAGDSNAVCPSYCIALDARTVDRVRKWSPRRSSGAP